MAFNGRFQSKLGSCLTITLGGTLLFPLVNIYKGNERFYTDYLMPAIHKLVDPERAHVIAIKVAKYSWLAKAEEESDQVQRLLETTVWGLKFKNPIGLAAGFDKNGEAVSGLSRMGFGFLEVGSVTPKPQPGNEKPRVFRLPADKAIINRYGFNSSGHLAVNDNLTKQRSVAPQVIIGINLGKNKLTVNASEDYAEGLRAFKENQVVDYFVINISSPNTPGLRNLQKKKHLEELLDKVSAAKEANKLVKPLLVKLSPDLSEEEKRDVADILMKRQKEVNKRIDGIIISNTTTDRPTDLCSDKGLISEEGGLSGSPLNRASTVAIRDMYRLTKGSIPIIGVGGIFSGQDAFDKIKAGASLLQIYTCLAFEGPPVVAKIKRELASLLSENGFSCLQEAIGKDINP